MICPHCRHEIHDEAVFCGACGKRVIGWKGRPQGGPREVGDSQDETRKVRPNSSLIRAAGGDPAATRRLAPNSDLLRVVRGEPAVTRAVRPDSSLIRATRGEELPSDERIGAQAFPTPPAPEPSGRSRAACVSGGDTAFLMEEALHRRRSRLLLLMVADACLLAVGIYLIFTWATRPARPSLPTSNPMPRTHGYVSWDDDGVPGRIATGPVKASFGHPAPKGSMEVMRAAPMPPPSRARPHPSMRPRSTRTRPTPRPHAMPPRPMDTPGADAKRIAAARKAFLAGVPKRIRRRRVEIRRCYEQTLKLIHNIRGYVDISFVVAASGKVTSARVTRNTTGSKTLGNCISGVFLSTTFPKPPGGAVSLRFPFFFSARK